MQRMQKHVLFYSNYCPFSREIVALLTQRNARESFVVVCVDMHRSQLPDFVDQVPLIYTADRQILVDSSVRDFIAQSFAPTATATSISDPMPGSASFNMSLSDAFSYLNSDDHEQQEHRSNGWDASAPGNYLVLDRTDLPRIQVPDEDERRSKSDVMDLDKYRAERDHDLQFILQQQNAPQHSFGTQP